MSTTIPTVEQYMTPCPHRIAATAALSEAHRLMREHGIRHLPVLDDLGALVGVVSMRDLHLLETLPDVDPDEVPVEDAMSEAPYVVAPDMPLDQVAADMAGSKRGSAVVVKGDEVLGMFTTIDALRALHAVLTGPRES